ncbi:MAG: hypothetical protein M1836_003794 [Candelina mexicana]|nr:MAG: hypothetical protein M1836_003794 [Candelina mexicana]
MTSKTTPIHRKQQHPHTAPQSEIKLAQPDRSGPKGKTLFELAEERQALLNKGKPFPKAAANGTTQSKDDAIHKAGLTEEVDEPIGPLGQAVFFTSTLVMLHFTLDVLVQHQYKQEIEWGTIVRRTGMVVPIYYLHPPERTRQTLTQIFFFCVANIAGCYLIYAANTQGYYAVMKRAPPLGTLWVWSVIEMKLPFAVASLLVAGIYVYYGEYEII